MDDAIDPRFAEYRRTGERALRNALVEEHRGLAAAVAARYRGRGVPADDLEQVALLGLIGAVERYDPSRGVPFGPWATMTMDGECKSWFRDRTWGLRVGRGVKELVGRTRRARDELEQELRRSPTVAQLADRLGESEGRVLEALDADQAYRLTSLDAGSSPDLTPSVPAGRGAGFADVDRRVLVEQLLGELDPADAEIVRLRFFGELSQQEIADRIGVSQMQVSRLLRRILGRLRELTGDDV
ncbi:MAG: sigma-70 family RNA polymerase sigma factor [Actinomycetota bacterium]